MALLNLTNAIINLDEVVAVLELSDEMNKKMFGENRRGVEVIRKNGEPPFYVLLPDDQPLSSNPTYQPR